MGIDFVSFYNILFDFGMVPTVFFFLYFIFNIKTNLKNKFVCAFYKWFSKPVNWLCANERYNVFNILQL